MQSCIPYYANYTRNVTQHFLRTTQAGSLHSLSIINKQTFMVSAEAVKRSEKKAKSEKKPDNAISEQVDGSFFIYPKSVTC